MDDADPMNPDALLTSVTFPDADADADFSDRDPDSDADADFSDDPSLTAATLSAAMDTNAPVLPDPPLLDPTPTILVPQDTNPNPNLSSSSAGGPTERRPLFQRLWTEEDEIVILRGFAEFTDARGTAFASHQYDTDPFCEDMRRRLQLDFTKSQLLEKLRRLKRKYRNCVARLRDAGSAFAFRSPHEQAIFEIARNIWRPSNKHGRDGNGDSDDENNNAITSGNANFSDVNVIATVGNVSNPNGEYRSSTSRPRRRRNKKNAVENTEAYPSGGQFFDAMPVQIKVEDSLTGINANTVTAVFPPLLPHTQTLHPPVPEIKEPVPCGASEMEKSCLAPLFKEMIHAVIGVGGVGMLEPLQLGLGAKLPDSLGVNVDDEKWRKQRVLELEVYLKRIELLQEHVKSVLEELKSSSSSLGT